MALKKLVQVGVQKNALGEVVAVFDLKTLNEEQVKSLKEQAQLYQARESEEKAELSKKIEELELSIKKVESELAYNRGELSREEYEALWNK